MMQYFEYIYSGMHNHLNNILVHLHNNRDESYLQRNKGFTEIGAELSDKYKIDDLLDKLINDTYIELKYVDGFNEEKIELLKDDESDTETKEFYTYYDITRKGYKFIKGGGYQPPKPPKQPKVKRELSIDEKRLMRKDKIDRYKLWHLRYIFLALIISGTYFILRIFGVDLIVITKNAIRWMFQ